MHGCIIFIFIIKLNNNTIDFRYFRMIFIFFNIINPCTKKYLEYQLGSNYINYLFLKKGCLGDKTKMFQMRLQ